MVVTVIAIKSAANERPIIRTFSSIEAAKHKVRELEKNPQPFSCQLLVDYSSAEFYKAKYEELFEMFVKNEKDKNDNSENNTRTITK